MKQGIVFFICYDLSSNVNRIYSVEKREEPKEVLFFKHDEFEKGEEPKSL